MAYDEQLAARVRELLTGEEGLTEKRMFGGVAFLVDGHLAVSASSSGGLLVRVEPAETDGLLQEEGVTPFQMRGRPMAGWLLVAPGAVDDGPSIERWVTVGLTYARTL